MKYPTFFLTTCLFFFAVSASIAQISEEEALVLRSNNPYLYDIALLKLDGKPRLGKLHYDNVQYSKANLPESNLFRFGRTATDVQTNLKMYFKLLEVKFMEDFYNQMQTEEPTAGTGNMSDMFKTMQGGPNQKSRFAQLHLMEVLRVLINEKGLNRYFCVEGDQCKKSLSMNLVWGGFGADEFAQHSAFQKFVKETLPDLLKRAQNLEKTRFVVVSSFQLFGKYDFDEQGFPIQISPTIYDKITRTVYVPKLDFELNAITNQERFKTLLKMSPEAARTLREQLDKDQRVYFTFEIQFQGIAENTTYNLSEKYLEYHLTSPVISLYQDLELTKKIGEVKIE